MVLRVTEMELLFVLLRLCQRCLAVLLYPVYWLLSLQTEAQLQAIREEILTMSATQLADKIRKRQVCELLILYLLYLTLFSSFLIGVMGLVCVSKCMEPIQRIYLNLQNINSLLKAL